MEPRDEQKDEMETMLSREGHGDTPMASASLPSGTEGCLTLWVVGFNVPHKDVKGGGGYCKMEGVVRSVVWASLMVGIVWQ